MISVDEARIKVLSAFSRLETEMVSIEASMNRILAEPVYADHDFPLFDNSSMDGIAVIAADTQPASEGTTLTLNLVDTIPAGQASEKTLVPGQAVRIMTGAPVPPGANAVIPVEDTDLDFSQPLDQATVTINRQVKPGDYIRLKGEFYRKDDLLLEPGIRIKPQDIALFATVGRTQISVFCKPRVGLLTTGDELIPPDQPLGPGKIRDSNSYMLKSMLQTSGAEVLSTGIIRDDELAIKTALDQLADSGVDLILTSGGVSMGAFDVVRKVMETYGSIDLWKVNMRPGKPLTFGRYGEIPFIGLAGNPMSAFVGFHIFVVPSLAKMAGNEAHYLTVPATLQDAMRSDGRESFIPGHLVNIEDTWFVKPVVNQSSGNLYALNTTNSLIILPDGVEFLSEGETAKVMML